MDQPYAPETLTAEQVRALPGAVVLEFGANWCPICQRAQSLIVSALAQAPQGLHHLKVEDGPGRPLGRSFGVKLWPTLVFLHNGRETARVVRPSQAQPLSQALERLLRLRP